MTVPVEVTGLLQLIHGFFLEAVGEEYLAHKPSNLSHNLHKRVVVNAKKRK